MRSAGRISCLFYFIKACRCLHSNLQVIKAYRVASFKKFILKGVRINSVGGMRSINISFPKLSKKLRMMHNITICCILCL